MTYGSISSAPRTGDASRPEADPEQERGRSPSSHADSPEQNGVEAEQHKVWQRLKCFYERNFGLFLVLMAQVFGSLVSIGF